MGCNPGGTSSFREQRCSEELNFADLYKPITGHTTEDEDVYVKSCKVVRRVIPFWEYSVLPLLNIGVYVKIVTCATKDRYKNKICIGRHNLN